MSYNDTRNGGGSATANGGLAGTGGGTSNGNRGRSNGAADAGRAAAQQRTYRGLPTTPMMGGAPAQYTETGYGAPVRMTPIGGDTAHPIKTALSPGGWQNWQGQVNTYNKAARGWNDRSIPERVANFFAPFGLGEVAPTLNRPKTYTGGTYHIGWNIPEFVAGMGGSLLGGPLGGFAAGQAGGLLGRGREVMLTGDPVPDTWDPNGGAPATRPYSPFADSGASPSQLGNPTNGGGYDYLAAVQRLQDQAALNAPVSGNPGAPKTTPETPTIFPKPEPRYSPIFGGNPSYGVWLYDYRPPAFPPR